MSLILGSPGKSAIVVKIATVNNVTSADVVIRKGVPFSKSQLLV